MVIDKTCLGVPLFDDAYGGVFRNRQTLCCGRHESGKSILGLHFINHALQEGERALLLTERLAADAMIVAQSLGMPLDKAVASGQLTILEYSSLITDQASSNNVMLPPEAFMELQEIISSQAIRRVVIDSVLPWVAIEPVTRLNNHVFSFIRALDRLETTFLLTLPKPLSNAAFTLKSKLKDLCPVAVFLDISPDGERSLKVTKYLGEGAILDKPLPFTIRNGAGIVAADAAPDGHQRSGPPGGRRPIPFSSVIRTA